MINDKKEAWTHNIGYEYTNMQTCQSNWTKIKMVDNELKDLHTRTYSPTPPLQAGCDTRSIFKQGLANLNSAFSLPNWLSYEG